MVGEVVSAAELKTLVYLEGGGIRYRSAIGRPSQAEFDKLAGEFLGSAAVKLGAIAAYGSLTDHVLAGPRGEDHCSYEAWRTLVDRHDIGPTGCPEVQEAIKIGDSIVIRRVDRSCRRSLSVLRGQRNPLEVPLSGRVVEVLDVSFARPMGTQNRNRISADLYLRTSGAVSEDLASAMTVHMRALTGIEYLGVRLRSDVWFVTACRFPALYPFGDQPRIPSKEEFQDMKQVACFASPSRPIRCLSGAGGQ